MYYVWQNAAGRNAGGDGWYLDADGRKSDTPVGMTERAAKHLARDYARCTIGKL